MSFSNDLIDLNGFLTDFTDEMSDRKWPEKIGNLDTSPILDNNMWHQFNTDNDKLTKLVSSEEDLISHSDCNSPYLGTQSIVNKKKPTDLYMSENWEKEFLVDLNNHHINEQMDHLADGFACNEVITVGEYVLEEDNASSPGSQNKTMADRWSSNDYNTVLRINNPNSKRVEANVEQSKDVDKSGPALNCFNKKENVNIVFAEDNFCPNCQERVYATEKLIINNLIYHRHCLKCFTCRRMLNMNNFSVNSGKLFCKSHSMDGAKETGKVVRIFGEHSENLMHDSPSGEHELPPPQITRNILEKFRLLESSNSGGSGGTESLLPRQSLSSGNQNMKQYQINNSMTTMTKNRTSSSGNDEIVETGKVENGTADELPTPGMTKILLSLWTNIENKQINSSDKSASACGTPRPTSKMTSQISNVSLPTMQVIRHDDHIEDNYPTPNTAKSLAEKFKGQPPPKPGVHQTQSNRSSNVNRNVLLPNNNSTQNIINTVSSSTPNEDWLQTRISDPNQGCENNPIRRVDLISSDSKDETDEFPEQGITRNLVGLFSSMELKH